MGYYVSDLINIKDLQHLMNSFYKATGISAGILTRDCKVISTTTYKSVCRKFHTTNPISQKNCIDGIQHIFSEFDRGKKLINYTCKNGLTKICTPIIIEGECIATIFINEIFFENPDIKFYEEQAEILCFDKNEYIDTIKRIPIVDKLRYVDIISFLNDLAKMVGEMGLRQLNLIKSQEQLKLTEERYKLSLQGSNDGMWDWNFFDNNFYASDRFIEITGHCPCEYKSIIQSIKKLIHPNDKVGFVKEFHKHLKLRTPHVSVELRIKSKGNNYKWVLIRGAAIFNSAGIPIRMAGSMTDLSEIKNTKQELKKEQDFSKIILDNANVIVCVWSPKCKLLSFNQYGKQITGYSDDEILGYKWFKILPTNYSKVLTDHILSISSGNGDSQVQSNFICKDGTTLDILWDSKIILDEDGSIKNVISIGLDITERINQEKRVAEFFSNISHELRTPLNIIFSYVQLMDSYLENGKIYNNIDKFLNHKNSMKQNCYRLLRLVNNLIDITKYDSGYLSLDIKKCNIVSLVEDITLSVSEYIENKGLEVIFDTNVEEKVIYCDPEKIERIILNLLSNAVKFTKPGGSIFVNLQNKKEKVAISIKDTGIGIEPHKLNVIFERFMQVNKSFTRENEGSGIGLSLVKSLVEMHNGIINVISDYGIGSEFIIELPASVIDLSEIAATTKELYELSTANKEKVSIEFSDIYIYK